jgi:translation initiation factor 2 alpha subunit (eIF-2alpha)
MSGIILSFTPHYNILGLISAKDISTGWMRQMRKVIVNKMHEVVCNGKVMSVRLHADLHVTFPEFLSSFL